MRKFQHIAGMVVVAALASNGVALAQPQPQPQPQTGVAVGVQVSGGSQGTSVSGTLSAGQNVGPVNVNGQASVTHNMPTNGSSSTTYNAGVNVAPKAK